MAGFRKAKAEQAALKYGIYGAAGRGKTLTGLLLAEGLAATTGKRVAVVDTEHGSDFYCKEVPTRKVHPQAFDFDAIYTKSITEIITAVRGLNPDEYGVVMIDSMTHLWEAARAAYNGKTTRAGTIPIYAWGAIKKPYKDLVAFLLSSPMHVILCGREGKEIETDEETDEMKVVGTKMKAEGETPYEPHILIHLFTERAKNGDHIIFAHFEKDRSSVLSNRVIQVWPSKQSAFELLAAPILPLLGDTQAHIDSEDDHASKDADALATDEQRRIVESERILAEYGARIALCGTLEQLKTFGKEITPALKKKMVAQDVGELRKQYQSREGALGGAAKQDLNLATVL